jgi:hypothetical protein
VRIPAQVCLVAVLISGGRNGEMEEFVAALEAVVAKALQKVPATMACT